MKTEPIVAAEVDFTTDPAAPLAPAFGDVYHPREGALAQAREIFIQGNALPQRWQGRDRFTVLETGFGLGTNVLAVWQAWRDDPARCAQLDIVSLEKHPLRRDDLARALATSPFPDLAARLLALWPPLVPGLHVLDLAFDGQHTRGLPQRLRLLLGFGDAARLARELVAHVDAFMLDGFAPARNPAMWSAELFTALARLAAPGATAATWSAARTVRDGLAAAGFEVQPTQGAGRKRHITLARYRPRHLPVRPPGRRMPAVAPTHALVIGAGLAGAAAARALARAGVTCTVLERASQPATMASGNPAGLFHATLGRDDGVHHRLHRAASPLAAQWQNEARATRPAIGAADGLLRLAESDSTTMHALLAAQRLPQDHVRALSADEASDLAGVRLAHPAWLFVRGGWADPAALVRHALNTPHVDLRCAMPVQHLDWHDGTWQACAADGTVLAAAPIVVLANAEHALPLAGLPTEWVGRSRGQVSWIAPEQVALGSPGVPRLPVASGGYALALPDGRLLIGATSQPGDDDPQVREADHAHNLARAAALFGHDVARADATLHGRVGWRVITRDKLPLVGAVPDLSAARPTRHAVRAVARRPGLYMLSGLGSRGLTTAALCGELIAAQVTGTPWPLEADLVDAIDPARFVLR